MLYNGIETGWSHVAIRLANSTTPLIGVKSLSYSKSREKQNNYGAGSKPVSRGYGNYGYEGEVTITMNELLKLQKSAPGNDILEMPFFEIVVTYVNKDNGIFATDVLSGCEFTSVPMELSQGDMEFEVSLELLIADVKNVNR